VNANLGLGRLETFKSMAGIPALSANIDAKSSSAKWASAVDTVFLFF
jgi:hypothetical protein